MMKIKVLLFAAVLSVSMASAAAAQQGMWTGFYAGANAGVAFGNSHVTTSPSNDTYFDADNLPVVAGAGSGSISTTGFAGGGQAGYNTQWGNLVFGGEVAFGALALSGSRSAVNVPYVSGCCNFTINESVQTHWLLTVQPRVGVVFGPSGQWMVDISGGLALTDLQSASQFSDTPGGVTESASVTKTQPGWTAGTSLAYALNSHWSAKLQYLFVDFGNVNSSGVANTFGQSFNHSADLNANILSFALNYKL